MVKPQIDRCVLVGRVLLDVGHGIICLHLEGGIRTDLILLQLLDGSAVGAQILVEPDGLDVHGLTLGNVVAVVQ